nr:MAG TPA: hypothetical protein [Caudoviricetes sp.]
MFFSNLSKFFECVFSPYFEQILSVIRSKSEKPTLSWCLC